MDTQVWYILSQSLWSTVWFVFGPAAENVEEADHNGWKFLILTNFHKFEYFSILTKIIKQNKNDWPCNYKWYSYHFIFLHLCSNLWPATSRKHAYILTFGWVSWNFKISGYSRLHEDSLWQQSKMKILLFVKSVTN